MHPQNTQEPTMLEAIGERVDRHAKGGPRWRYHLPRGRVVGDAEFQPVACGGGIVFPGHRVEVARDEVCPDCLAGRLTMPRAPR